MRIPVWSSNQLDSLAAWIEAHVLDEDCDILEATQTVGASGKVTDVWNVVETVKSAVTDAGTGSPSTRVVGMQEEGQIDKLILLPRNTAVKQTNRLRVGGVTYTIIDFYDPSTYRAVDRVLVRRVSLPLPPS